LIVGLLIIAAVAFIVYRLYRKLKHGRKRRKH
jgi:uncharacterized membrane protein YwaF